jgi:3-phenylpropionate/trans-cinnamate dioxygenase ferredoxin reductase subunit
VLGAGVGAASAADTLRSNGFDGRLILIGAERDVPYNRPMLSKERLRGEATDEQTFFHPAEQYRTLDVELALNHALTRVDFAERRIYAQDNSSWTFDKLLIATGAHPRHVETAAELDGVYYLRSLVDCRALSDVLRQRPRVLVLGTGFIGCEVAASARTLGCEVTIVGRHPPLAHVLGEELGNIYTEYHRAHGIDVRSGVNVERFDGAGKVERAALSDGSTVACDVAVIGVGVTPAVEMLQGQPIEMRNGIVVNEFCQTNVPDVFAAGDVAFSWNPRYATHLRVEHFDNAQRQAAVAAKAMLGPTEPYNPIPSFWSDQFTYGLQYRGYAPAWDSVVLRGKPAEASFTAFYLSGGKLNAVCSINRYKENSAARKLIGKAVDPKALADDGVEINSLVGSAS